ncbi:MAG: methyltransferase domain-containing protein [Gammaproteobacteria bacterium]|nr:methyltransferase domain-containing protein [Gammaproteobacteria bacterium]
MPQLICPLCQEALLENLPQEGAQHSNRVWRCVNNHSFDMAREGYLNLHLVQHKKSKDPGDNPEMVKARREFLHADYYQPLRDAIVELLKLLHATSLLDIGCGEGYYTSSFRQIIDDVIGLDIAKPAIQLSAKKFKNITWLVGSGAMLPIATASVDIVSSMFSPLPIAEMARVLQPDGFVLVATPAPTHLWAMREGLFGEVQAHEPDKFLAGFDELFTLHSRTEVSFPLSLSNQALKDLLCMTPYVWKAKPEKRAALELLESFETAAAFTIFLFQKK